ncbi:MAG: LytTR family DNA-binding domain-containing protein [Bacteroidetes bacterium]|nr:LytTR family DNA-binding domain-containing protein [Bacteroidota bacterium]
MLKTIIVDDEDHVRGTLGKFLEKYCPKVTIAGEAGSVQEAYEVISKIQPDLVLLDIQLGDGTGFDLLKKFELPPFKVIFITAHDEFAVQAFKVSALDFILKPVNPIELQEALTKAQQVLQDELRIKLEALETNLQKENSAGKKIVIKTLENIYVIDTNDIVYCESDGSYTTIFTIENETIVSSKPIKEYDELLTTYGFFRVHRSYLINLAFIKRFEKQDGGYVILSENAKVPVASRKRDELIELLDHISG